MLGSTKNQHYVPKFYLKKFSIELNQKEIGLYNVGNLKFIKKAPLKSQASKDYYYGRDGKLENWLGGIEGKLAKTINRVLLLEKPLAETEFYNMVAFIVLTNHRNPSIIENNKGLSKTMDGVIKEMSPGIEYENIPDLGHEFAVVTAIDNLSESINYCLDLSYKILINKTKVPFIVSDNPVIKYNQFLEQRKWPHSKTGLGCIGLQIIVPLSPEVALCLYDSRFYKIGKQKDFKVIITNYADIFQLNLLQLLNCNSTCYFNENITEAYMKNLHKKSDSYSKANIATHSVMKALDSNNEKIELVKLGRTDCEINLKCTWIKYTSNALSYVLGNKLVYLRPYCSQIRAEIKLREGSHERKSGYTIRKKNS